MEKTGKSLVVVSNRLPAVIEKVDGQWRIGAAAGGLVTALTPLMRGRGGLWIGWPGAAEEAPLAELLAAFNHEQGYRLHPVPLTPPEVDCYYHGFSNEALWPLFHDLLGHCSFSRNDWECYCQVNRRFAEITAAAAGPHDPIWVHDYHLALVGEELRRLGSRQALAYFLHIPFPVPDLFRRHPWKTEFIRALLAYDLLGFQTLRDRRNFVNTAVSLLPEVQVISRQRHVTILRYQDRLVKVGHFPISIDFAEFADHAQSSEVAEAAWYLHENLLSRQLVLGIDRLDYTKGIPERFLAFERALEKYPDLIRNVSLLQIVVPSRTEVPEYQKLKETLDSHAGRINGRFAEGGWVPVHYVYRSLNRVQLLAHYRAAEIALITPLRDGMNLVAKEYCASSVDNNGVLILSEFAGAAEQLAAGAILVNPYDIDSSADAIHQAFTMDSAERSRRMALLRAEIRRNDVHRWLRWFVDSLEA